MDKTCLKCKKQRSPNQFNTEKPMYCLLCVPLRKSRAALAVRRVDYDREQNRLLTVLHRDIEKLMDASFKGILSREESATLISYLKLIGELRAIKLLEDAEKHSEENPC